MLVGLLLTSVPQGALAQDSDSVETVRLVPGAEYDASGASEFFVGSGYRDAWTAEIEVEVLDMQAFAGGLEPLFRVGGMQTFGLAMSGADGRAYTFRSVNKNLAAVLPSPLDTSPIGDLLQDQVSAYFPGGQIVATRLADSAGVLTVMPSLVVMPDDPALGEFQEIFAGRLGTIEEYPTAGDDGAPGTFGAVEIVSGVEMLGEIEAANLDQRADVQAFLRARLVDLFLGDWDRHEGQWRFARIPGEPLWQPIAEDRDAAFNDFRGIALAAVADREPKLGRFDASFSSLEGLLWNSRNLDRLVLSGLSREEFREEAEALQAVFTDQTIEAAIAVLPIEHQELVGPRLRDRLRNRRDELTSAADEFYLALNEDVRVTTTNDSERVLIQRDDDGGMQVTIWREPAAPIAGLEVGEPFFDRYFTPDETDEVRLYLGDGDDQVEVQGEPGDILVRVIGAYGDNVLTDPDGETYTFGIEGDSPERGRGERVDSGLRLSPGERLDATPSPVTGGGAMLGSYRDHGRFGYIDPYFGFGNGLGFFFGAGVTRERYGFRQLPYAARHRVRAGFSTDALRPRADYRGYFRVENRPALGISLRTAVSGIDLLRFYGIGNETPEVRSDVTQWVGEFESLLAVSLGDVGEFTTGPIVRALATELDGDPTDATYGTGEIFQAGWVARLTLDSDSSGLDEIPWDRRTPRAEEESHDDDEEDLTLEWDGFENRLALSIYGRAYPSTLGVELEESYAVAGGTLTTYIALFDWGVQLALRAGGQYSFGDFPFYDAAYVGNAEVRGLSVDRFAGESSLFGNAELRIRLFNFKLGLPIELGIFGLTDVGRVFVDAENSDVWHRSFGGGLWLEPVGLGTPLSVSVAQSDEGLGVNAALAFFY